MRKPTEDIRIFTERRRELAQKIPGACLIIASHPEMIRNHDVHHSYRQDSNFHYLTGFDEPESIFVFRPGMVPETVLFVRVKDKVHETWNGFRYGPEGAEEFFKIDKAYCLDDFEKETVQLLKEVDHVYYRLFKNPTFDQKIQSILEATSKAHGRSGYGLLPVYDADQLIGEMRIKKSPYEIETLKKACQISAEAHLAAMHFTKPGVNERQIHSVLLHNMMMRGAQREGYGSIVASGNNATTLHYVFNDENCQKGDLLLVDAGAEYNFYTGDITRTYPVSGKFTDEQAELYDGVLRIQKTIINTLKPGITFKELNEMATTLLTDMMLDLGLLNGRKTDIIEALEHKKYYPHSIGHWLGMDVHDAGLYLIKDQPRPLEENMCFTIEPGLYIPADDFSAPAKYRGIGIRIEDNIRITLNGHEVMTANVPKEIADLEKVVGGSY